MVNEVESTELSNNGLHFAAVVHLHHEGGVGRPMGWLVASLTFFNLLPCISPTHPHRPFIPHDKQECTLVPTHPE